MPGRLRAATTVPSGRQEERAGVTASGASENATVVGAPTFVVTNARSGSTMLRWLLDGHPQVACPSETGIADLVSDCVLIPSRLGFPDGREAAHDHARALVEGIMAAYLRERGKSRWCDKSLTTVDHVDLLATVWPEARFVFLYRHCMDFVHSALEAEPWGLSSYGFGEFARMSPTDNVSALVAYWHDRVHKMLQAEQRLPLERRIRLRYEDLVADTDQALQPIWRFVGVEPLTDASAAAFGQFHDGVGPADHKIWLSGGVHQESVGRGARIPASRINRALREAVNGQLSTLGYPTVDLLWGAGGPPPADEGDDDRLDMRIVDGHRPLWRGILDLSAGEVLDPAKVAPAPLVVAVERRVLPELIADRRALPAASRRRDVRWYGPKGTNYEREQMLSGNVAELLAVHGEYLMHVTAG